MTKKGKKHGKGKQKYVPFETFTENLTSGSSDGKKASKKSNIKDFNNDTIKTETNPMSPTSDTLESSADVSTISDSTKGDESTDTSSKLCGQLDESILDDNKTDISYCSEGGISYGNHESQVKNGNQNLSKSFHSDESFHKSPTKFENHGSNRKGSNKVNRKDSNDAPKLCHNLSNFQQNTYSMIAQGADQNRLASTSNTKYNVQHSQSAIKSQSHYEHSQRKSTGSGDGSAVHKNNEFDKRNRYDKRNESTNQGKFRDKGGNYGRTSPHDISNSETPPQIVNVLAEKQKSTRPSITNVLTKNKKSKEKPYGTSDYINTERQNLAKENKILDDDSDAKGQNSVAEYENWDEYCENADSLSSMPAENRFVATNTSDEEKAKQSKGKFYVTSDYINKDKQNLTEENENCDDDYQNTDSLSGMQAENRWNQNWGATNTSDTENNKPKYREMGSFKDTPSTTDDHFENKWSQKSNKNTENWRRDSRKSYPAMSSHHENTSKRFSEGNKEDWNKGSSKNRNYYDRYSESTDKEFKTFCDEERSKKKIEFVRVEEIVQDLFAMSNEYSLAHCVAEDMRMGSGIAVTFKREFKQMDSLLDQRQKQGGLAVLEDEANEGTRYIYYLITKRESSGKPTYEKFWSSLQKMRNHIRDNGVKKLAIPRLGCGLDRLEWDRVKHMIEFLFRDVEVKITVCNFQQTEESPEKPVNYTCKVVNVAKAVADIEEETTIIYLSSEDGYVSGEMEELDKKFSFLNEFRRARKQLGDVIKYEVKNKYYILYGCIVRKTQKDPFNFKSFTKCLSQISKNNRKDKYIYIGIQAIKDNNDDLLMEKILSILKNYMSKVDIYVCWHGDLVSKMPISSRDF